MSNQGSKVNTDGFSYGEVVRLMEEGEVDGIYPVGVLQQYERAVGKNLDEVLKLCFFDAEKGNARSQAFAGYCLLFEIGVKRNRSRAFYWYKRSAEQGYAVAQYALGCMCSAGVGTHRSNRRSAQWLLLAAEQKHPEALESMAGMYKSGKGVKKDKGLAFSFLKRAAATNLPSAQYSLGLAYVYKSYGEMDVEYGIRLLESAAENGIEKAKKYLEQLNEFIVDPFISFSCDLPDECQIPLRRKTIMLLDQVGFPLYGKMATDVRDFVCLHPQEGFHFLEHLGKLEECAVLEEHKEIERDKIEKN